MRNTLYGLTAGSFAAMMMTASVQAADLGGNCCADLEERVAELEATTARKGNRVVSLEVSGHVNEAILFYDDDFEENVVIGSPVNSRSRFRFKGSANINADWSAGFLMEFGVRSNSLSGIDQDNPFQRQGESAIDTRHEALYVKSKTYGTVWLGHTGSATEGITEIFLGGNLETPFPLLSGGGLKLRFNDGTLSGTSLINAAGVQGEFKQGEGNRREIIRYISPTLAGFVVSAAAGGDDFYDVALRYAGEFGDFRVAAGVGYQHSTDEDDEAAMFRNCANQFGEVDCGALGASGGIMHVPTGLYVNASYGYIEQDNDTGVLGDRDEHWAIYVGIERKWSPLGKTNIWGSYGESDSEIRSQGDLDVFSIGVVQNIDAAAMELYITYRNIDATGTQIGGARDGEFVSGDVDLLQLGARIRF
ncbi:MAG: porin [Alphaproteobacteria bacterium]|nr:porin [Alphaproteobacteria bacterium]